MLHEKNSRFFIARGLLCGKPAPVPQRKGRRSTPRRGHANTWALSMRVAQAHTATYTRAGETPFPALVEV